MRLLTLPFRFAAAVVAWAIGSALVIVIEAGLTRGHAPLEPAIGAPLLALGLGAIVGTVVWRMSRSHPFQAGGILAVLVAAFVMAAVLGGAAVRGLRMETYRITSDIERIETSVTVAGRRVGIRAALLLLVGLLLSIGLVGLLAPALGSPTLFVPIGLAPLYLAALIAFVRPGDGRPIEMQLVDRARFARATKRAANLGPARLESGSNVLDLTKEVFSVKDVRTGHEVMTDLTELEMPFTVRGHSDLRLLIDDLRITVRREEGSDEIAVTVRQA